MNRRIPSIFMLVLISSLIPQPSSFLRADGGAVRLRERVGGYQITVFTSPTPFRAGPVDISVLVQDAATGECVPAPRVTVRLTARGTGEVLQYPATAEAATNKLFHAAVFQLPDAGWWGVEVAVDGPHGPALLRFGVEADEPPPRWLELWPWFGWPAAAVALFGIHRGLVRRRNHLPTRRGEQEVLPLSASGRGSGGGVAPIAPVANIVIGQRVDPAKVLRANELRRQMTPAERRLWNCLRANRLGGRQFRRQQVIDSFIVDFCCHAAAVVVEVDDPVHEVQAEYDAERDRILTARGLRVVRFTNEQINRSLPDVLRRLEAICRGG